MLQVYLPCLSSFYLPFVPLFSFLRFLIFESPPYSYFVKYGTSKINFHLLYNHCVFGLHFRHFVFGQCSVSSYIQRRARPFNNPVQCHAEAALYLYWEGITDGVQSASSHYT